MIPFAMPFLGDEEVTAAREVILSGWVTQGPKVKQFEDMFSSYVCSKYACAVSSCTDALHLALIAVGVKPGDVVITVSHSFIATANSIRHCGAEPVFVDIDVDTFNMSSEYLERFLEEDCEIRNNQLYYKKVSEIAVGESPLRGPLYINSSRYQTSVSCHKFLQETLGTVPSGPYYQESKSRGTRVGRVAAIMPVHQMGMPCDLNAILSLTCKFNLPVVEDAACAVGSEITIDGGKTWERIGRPHGDIACFSFHPRKLITTGEGGMITTDKSDYDKKIRLLRHHGMSISDVARHNAREVIFEQYVTTGYNCRMSDIQAGIGIVQLRKLPHMVLERRKIANIYHEKLKNISWLKLPEEDVWCKSNWQSYPVRLLEDAPLSRNELMQYLLDAGVSTRRGVMNAHQELPYKSLKWNLPMSERAGDFSFLLPIFNSISQTQIEQIITILKKAEK